MPPPPPPPLLFFLFHVFLLIFFFLLHHNRYYHRCHPIDTIRAQFFIRLKEFVFGVQVLFGFGNPMFS